MAKWVTVWDPKTAGPTKTLRPKSRHQIDRIVMGVGCRNAPESPRTLRNARAENGHQIARIMNGMGARNAPGRQMIHKPL